MKKLLAAFLGTVSAWASPAQISGEKLMKKLAAGSDTKNMTQIEFLASDKKTPITKITGDMEKFYIRYSISKENASKIKPDGQPKLHTTIKAGQVSDDLKNPQVNICDAAGNDYVYNKDIIEKGYAELEITLKGTSSSLLYMLEMDEVFKEGVQSGKQTYVLNFSILTKHQSPYKNDIIYLASSDIELEVDGSKLAESNKKEWENCYRSGTCAPATQDKAFINRCLEYAKMNLRDVEFVHIAPQAVSLEESGTVRTFDCWVTAYDKSTGKLRRHLFLGKESSRDHSYVNFVHQSVIEEVPVELKDTIGNVM